MIHGDGANAGSDQWEPFIDVHPACLEGLGMVVVVDTGDIHAWAERDLTTTERHHMFEHVRAVVRAQASGAQASPTILFLRRRLTGHSVTGATSNADPEGGQHGHTPPPEGGAEPAAGDP